MYLVFLLLTIEDGVPYAQPELLRTLEDTYFESDTKVILDSVHFTSVDADARMDELEALLERDNLDPEDYESQEFSTQHFVWLKLLAAEEADEYEIRWTEKGLLHAFRAGEGFAVVLITDDEREASELHSDEDRAFALVFGEAEERDDDDDTNAPAEDVTWS